MSEVTAPLELPPAPLSDLVLEAELGRGGAGVVYRAHQGFLDRRVAVKLLHRDHTAGSAASIERFAREARLLASLQHPHIVTCHQAGVGGDGQPFLVMELVDGPDLRSWIEKTGPLPPQRALEVIADLASGLAHAQGKGIIHRDIKPENVLLAPRSEAPAGDPFPFTAKLADLGLARLATQVGQVTQPGVIVGTPSSMAPEQFEYPEGIDHRADIYALGCVLCFLATGRHPFAASSLSGIIERKFRGDLRRLLADLPTTCGLADLARDMLARDPAERPAQYTDVIARCHPGTAPSEAKRRPLLGPALAFGAVAAVAAVFLIAALRTPPPPVAPMQPVARPPADPPAPEVKLAVLPAPVPTAWSPPRQLLVGVRTGLPGWTGIGALHAPHDELDALVLARGTIRHPLPPAPCRLEAVLARAPGLQCDAAVVGVSMADGSIIGVALQDLGAETILQSARLDPEGQVVYSADAPVVVPTPTRWRIVLTVLADRVEATVDGQALPMQQLPGSAVAAAIVHRVAEVGTRGAVLIEQVSLSEGL